MLKHKSSNISAPWFETVDPELLRELGTALGHVALGGVQGEREILFHLFHHGRIYQPSAFVARACSSRILSSARSSDVLQWKDRSSKMMYLFCSSSMSSNCDMDFLPFLPFVPVGYDPIVAMGLLLSPTLPSSPDVPAGLVPPRIPAPKSFLTRGKSVGMQAPMRTQFASIL